MSKPRKNKLSFFAGYILLFIAGGLLIIYLIYRISMNARNSVIESMFGPIQTIEFKKGRTGDKEKLKSRNLLRVAVAPIISPENSLVLYRRLVDYLGEKISRRGILILRPSYAEVNELLRNGGADVAFVCTYAYVRGKRDFGMEIIATPVIGGKTTYHSYVIVPTSSDANSLLELKNKSFASCDLLSTSGWLFPALWLKRRGEDPERFFSEHIITGSHDRAVYAVAQGYVDGAAVDNIVYEGMPADIRSKTKVVLRSPPFGMPPVVVHPDLEFKLKREIQNILLNAHKDPVGKSVLSTLDIDSFIIADETLYRDIEEMVEIWEAR